MKSKGLIALIIAALLLSFVVPAAFAVNDSSFTTNNPHVDGTASEDCANSSDNCNGYSAKEFVWLNGSSLGHGLDKDGAYFFAVLVPGGQQNPNDGSEDNLSDDFDTYNDRTFDITNGELSAYTGPHWLDSGKNETQESDSAPNGLPPYVRLSPFGDTTNPGGVYVLAICTLENGYPVDPSLCKFETFKVSGSQTKYSFSLQGMFFEDMYADGVKDAIDTGLKSQKITISGVGSDGQVIDDKVNTDADGFWEYRSKTFSFMDGHNPVDLNLTICEELQPGWIQSYPGDDGCHTVTLAATDLESISDLDFGTWQPVDVTACKARVNKGEKEPQAGWVVSLSANGSPDDLQVTDSKGCYTWSDLMPGVEYGIRLESSPEGRLPEPLDWVFPRAKSGESLIHTFNTASEGCTPGFWQGGNAIGSAGGKWLWNTPQDLDWIIAGGQGWNPFDWTTPFNSYFTPYAGLNGMDMLSLVDSGGGSDDSQKAARDLVAAYLNASWGMNYPYTTDQLEEMWLLTVDSGNFLSLHDELDAANNAHKVGGNCPIDAKNEELPFKLFLPLVMR